METLEDRDHEIRTTYFLSRPLFVSIHFALLLIPTPMSDYDIRPGGSLKLKGGVTEGGVVKR